MRVCLVAHGFPPLEKAGVENFTAQLARGLARAGHQVEVFVPRLREDLPDLSLRHERRDGYGVHWFTGNSQPRDPAEQLDPPGRFEQFDAFLEREKPDVVHFHHVVKLGLGLIEAAHARDVPTVYTVHDYYPVCHRITLLRPDLERCATIGEPAVCARCDLALAVLNERPELGDYHMGAFGSDLDGETAARLSATLAGEQAAAGFDEGEWTEAVERRTRLDRRRREVFGMVDRLVAPTRFLAERLEEGGLDPDRIVHLPYGIDTSLLTDLPRAGTEELTARPLRIGFVGSMTKHKGVHVLLAAWRELELEAELHLWGDSTDRPYVERCRREADALGARWHGAFDQRELPGILGRLDAVVVPSIWVENYPIAIREALAAGRPVVASRVGALPESVRDGVDGRLFEPGDAADLARVLRELIADPARLVALRAGAEPVETLASQVDDYLALYDEARGAVAARRVPEPEPLPHLAEIAGRYAELHTLSSNELFEQAVERLDRLGPVLGGERRPAGAVLARALVRDARTQERLRDRTTERDYLRAEIERHEATEHALRASADWRASQVEGLEEALDSVRRERDWLEGTVKGLEERVGAAERERDWRAGNERALDEKARWLEEEVANRDAELEHLSGVLSERDRLLYEAERMHTETVAAAEARVEELRADFERDLTELRGELDRLTARIAESRVEVDSLRAELSRVDAERVWRESEMRDAVRELERVRGSLLPARFLLRGMLERWRASVDEEPPSAGGPTPEGSGA